MSNGETKTGQERQENGQYGSKMSAVCVCGHALGAHTAARPYECLVDCECRRFKKARAK